MKVAITIWGTRISPVFDSSRNLLVAEIDGTEIVARTRLSFDARQFARFVELLREIGVQVLICGALCEGPSKILEVHGIQVISFLTGEVERVLECFIQGQDLTFFSLPGCRWGMCRRTREGGRIRNKSIKEDRICRDLMSKVRKEKDQEEKKDEVWAKTGPEPLEKTAGAGKGLAGTEEVREKKWEVDRAAAGDKAGRGEL